MSAQDEAAAARAAADQIIAHTRDVLAPYLAATRYVLADAGLPTSVVEALVLDIGKRMVAMMFSDGQR